MQQVGTRGRSRSGALAGLWGAWRRGLVSRSVGRSVGRPLKSLSVGFYRVRDSTA